MLFSRRSPRKTTQPLLLTEKRKRTSSTFSLLPLFSALTHRRHRRQIANVLFACLVVLVLGYRAFPSETADFLDRVEEKYRNTMPTLSLSALSLRPKHPIETLMEDGKRKWEQKLRRQSKTLEEAVTEYRRRYGINPPNGFDKWYDFAKRADFQLIDEFDAINEDLMPFRRLSSYEVQARTRSAAKQDTMFTVNIKDGQASAASEIRVNGTKKGDLGRARGFVQTIASFVHDLPDMAFAVSGLAESSVYPTWEVSQPDNFTTTLEKAEDHISKINNFALWYKFTNTCHPADPVRQHLGQYSFPPATSILPPRNFDELQVTGETSHLGFLKGTESDLDFCRNPERFYEFGHFYTGWPVFNESYPVFGPGKAPGSIDIRIPSYYYFVPLPKYTYGFDETLGRGSDDDPHDPEWDKKAGTMFWRGATTGGGSSPNGRYSYYVRHRLVQLANQDNPSSMPIRHLTGHGFSEAFTESRIDVNKLRTTAMDIAFTKAVQCSPYRPGGCEGMMRDYVFVEKVPLHEAYKSKILLDLDGMGYSARSMALLASKSALVKSTIYREFFEDWLQPWVHFIPITSTFDELFNIWAYFIGMPEHLVDPTSHAMPALPGHVYDVKGDAALKSIADQGRQWKRQHARIVDMEVYVYRLCLEWARLWYKDEQDMDYVEAHNWEDAD